MQLRPNKMRGYPNMCRIPAAASIALGNDKGGKFIYCSSGYATKVDGNTAILGWAHYAGTGSATAGVTVLDVDHSTESVYEMPISAASTEAALIAILGEYAQIDIASTVQKVTITTASYAHVLIVGYKYYDATYQTVFVKICAARQQSVGIS